MDIVGDLFHYGHVHDLGYKVVVGVHSDEIVETYKRTPIIN